MKNEVYYFLAPLAIAFCLIPMIKVVSKFLKLYDAPTERKVHTKPIPALGGIAVFVAFMITILFSGLEIDGSIYLFLAAFVLFGMGLLDDIRGLSARRRLLIQFVCAGLCFAAGYAFQSDYSLLGIGSFPFVAQVVTTLLFVVLLINAFNLIDGVNGLAGGLGFLISVVFSYLFSEAGNQVWSIVAFIFSGALLGFLYFNFGKASIFLGDNGSTIIGLIVSIYFLQYINLPTIKQTSSENLVQGLSLMTIPVLDLIRVSVERIQNGNSPFHADQTHIHHILLRQFGNHQSVTKTILLFQLALYMLSQILVNILSSFAMLAIIILTYLLFIKIIKVSQDLSEIKSTEQKRRQLGILY